MHYESSSIAKTQSHLFPRRSTSASKLRLCRRSAGENTSYRLACTEWHELPKCGFLGSGLRSLQGFADDRKISEHDRCGSQRDAHEPRPSLSGTCFDPFRL